MAEIPLIYTTPTTDTLGDDASLKFSQPASPPRPPVRRLPIRRKTVDRRIFQNPKYWPTVRVQTIAWAQRSLFAPRSIPESFDYSDSSPSHYHIVRQLSLTADPVVRQLQFSPSVGRDNFKGRHLKDGRYRSIDVIEATVARLPPTPPRYTKHRLPIAADVGFGTATPKEVALKRLEIVQETQWEEASPRLIVLVTSRDLGKAVEDGPELMFAGPELKQTLEHNAKVFSGQQTVPPSSFCNPNSVLAPPLGVVYSKSLGWKSRPYLDRPHGLSHVLVSPLLNSPQQLVGSLTLYSGQQAASEAFWFPIGPWKGRTDDLLGPKAAWQEGRLNAVFGYQENLWVVVQVFRPSLEPYLLGVTRLEPGGWPQGGSQDVRLVEINGKADFNKRLPVLQKQNSTGKRDPQAGRNSSDPPDERTLDLWMTALPEDYLQALLHSENEGVTLLADASGDFAVVVDPNQPRNLVTGKRRSDLLRLPPSKVPAGYVTSAEFRQVYSWTEPSPPHVHLLYLQFRETTRTIRVQIMNDDGKSDEPLVLFHSPTWWKGSLVSEIELRPHVEVKVRLPMPLQASTRLVFSQLNKGSVMAQAKYSFCRLKDGVVTLLPNGHHSVRLGSELLEWESRLVSDVHVPDEALGTLLKRFPYKCGRDEEMEVSEASLGDCAKLLLEVEPSSLVRHNRALLHMHLCNLANDQKDLLGNMKSLFLLLRLLRKHVTDWAAFTKELLDNFDESFLSNVSQPWADKVPELTEQSSSQEEQGQEEELLEENHGAIRVNRQKLHRSSRVEKVVASLGQSGIPLPRAPYGASKEELMKAEAEYPYVQFFEDDETIATMSTRGLRSIESRLDGEASIAPELLRNPTKESPIGIQGLPKVASAAESDFADRVRHVAQAMLAPCVGPTIANALRPQQPRQNMKSSLVESARKFDVVSAVETKDQDRWWDPGTDDEDDLGSGDNHAVLRGPADAPVLLFSVRGKAEDDLPVASGDYVYETVMVLWLRSWLDDHMEALNSASPSDHAAQTKSFSVPNVKNPSSPTLSFYSNMDVLLPICLKSLVLRYSVEILPMHPDWTRGLIDERHMKVFGPFIELLARGLMGQASATDSQINEALAISRALESADHVLDFLVGLFSVLHPEHMRILVNKYFKTLRECETEHFTAGFRGDDSTWTPENLHRVRCSRHLRLRAIEVLSCLPSFLSLNFPLKCPGSMKSKDSKSVSSWMYQVSSKADSYESDRDNNIYGSSSRLPMNNWLAEILITEGMSVCSLSCEAVVFEAMAHAEASRDASKRPASAPSALKKRPGASLSRDDMLMFQSVAIHAITVIYELVLRRHAMDRRFQNPACHERIASVVTRAVLLQSMNSVRWLARMESTHKVRTTWLLCVLYVLQEAPASLLRLQIRELCKSSVSSSAMFWGCL